MASQNDREEKIQGDIRLSDIRGKGKARGRSQVCELIRLNELFQARRIFRFNVRHKPGSRSSSLASMVKAFKVCAEM